MFFSQSYSTIKVNVWGAGVIDAFHHRRARLPHRSRVWLCNPETFPPLETARRSTVSVWVRSLIMSGRKTRYVANPLESAITTPSERILKECHSLYVDSENGKYPPATRITAALKHKQADKSVVVKCLIKFTVISGAAEILQRCVHSSCCQCDKHDTWTRDVPLLAGSVPICAPTANVFLHRAKPGYFHFKQM